MFEELETRRVLIFGCGNVLMGDDGFGPAVIKRLNSHHDLPADAHAEDVGTSVRDILFNLTLLDKRPEHIVVVDATDKPGRSPAEVFEIFLEEAAKAGAAQPPALLSTHPLSSERIAEIKALAREQGWAQDGKLTPLPPALNSLRSEP